MNNLRLETENGRSVGVLIGRFQTPALHDGHKALLRYVLGVRDEVCILVGVAPEQGLKNPLPYPAVEQMIRGEFQDDFTDRRLHIHPLRDVPGEDLQWSHQIDTFLQLLFPDQPLTLYSGRDSYKSSYHGRFRPVVDWYGYDGNVNASKVREEIVTGVPIDSEDSVVGSSTGSASSLTLQIQRYLKKFDYIREKRCTCCQVHTKRRCRFLTVGRFHCQDCNLIWEVRFPAWERSWDSRIRPITKR